MSGGSESGVKSVFRLLRSHNRLQGGFGGVCGCGCGTLFGPVLFEPNDLRPTILGCQATDSIPPQASRKGITQTIILTPSRAVLLINELRLPNPLVPSAKMRSANLPVLASLVWGLNPASRTPR